MEILVKIVDELLRFKESPVRATAVFATKKHNRDLCPQIGAQLNRIVDCFEKYRRVVYDVQGIRDYGTDLLISDASGQDQKCICIQIKSYDDLKESDYLTKLQAQFLQTTAFYGQRLQHYYILLATDGQVHIEKIRSVKNEFKTFANVTVIDPTFIITFLGLDDIPIYGMAEFFLKEEDEVFSQAKYSIISLTPTEIGVLLTIIASLLNGSSTVTARELASNGFLVDLYSRLPNFGRRHYFHGRNWDGLDESEEDEEDDESEEDEEEYGYVDNEATIYERVLTDLEHMDENGELVLAEDSVKLNIEAILPLLAVISDAAVRYDYSPMRAAQHIFSAIDVVRRYKIQEYF